MSRRSDSASERGYDLPRDDGCAGCGAPRMRGNTYCVTCATADEVSGDERAVIAPMRSTGHWHQASRTEMDGVTITVYRGPTWHPTPKGEL